jgi:catechol 2,3-dioxygenase-like lactoylglutathione lyase family enzyme
LGLERAAAGQRGAVDFKLEVIVIPVGDVDRAKGFYTERLGWRLDADFAAEDGLRVVQVTPPGSGCSVIFGDRLTTAGAGSVEGLHLVVQDIEQARAEMVQRGIDVSEPFHDAGGIFHHGGTEGRVPGPDPQHGSYDSFATFADPDGNGWVMQEVRVKAPGR